MGGGGYKAVETETRDERIVKNCMPPRLHGTGLGAQPGPVRMTRAEAAVEKFRDRRCPR